MQNPQPHAQWVILPALPNQEQDGKRLLRDPSLVPNLKPRNPKRVKGDSWGPLRVQGVEVGSPIPQLK